MIASGHICQHIADSSGNSLNLIGFGSNQLKNVRIFLMRHDAASRSQIIRKSDKRKMLIHEKTNIGRQSIELDAIPAIANASVFFQSFPGYFEH